MGVGDDILATGMAKGAAARGKRIAFGDRRRILWGQFSEIAFRNNPNIAPPGSEGAPDLEWIEYYKGKRWYNSLKPGSRHWTWNYDFRAKPGEFYFSQSEIERGARLGTGFVLIEPNVPAKKSVARNKQWAPDRYQDVASQLRQSGRRVVQLNYPGMRYRLDHVEHMQTDSFRDAVALLSNAALYIGAEGGTHHAAAAVGVHGVVIMGGFIPPEVVGYDMHINLTGAAKACGSLDDCEHCRKAMDTIYVSDVMMSAFHFLELRLVS